jgi:hypothetical protein
MIEQLGGTLGTISLTASPSHIEATASAAERKRAR